MHTYLLPNTCRYAFLHSARCTEYLCRFNSEAFAIDQGFQMTCKLSMTGIKSSNKAPDGWTTSISELPSCPHFAPSSGRVHAETNLLSSPCPKFQRRNASRFDLCLSGIGIPKRRALHCTVKGLRTRHTNFPGIWYHEDTSFEAISSHARTTSCALI